ncbi:Ger(x)C family spore germination protein [Fictibacillus phosphorivorans]|uniref:Ger(x)C family spore germination protein n=1 Tax=Fictibacillus phosphorivorans TaxID=1221500 RepID=UPI001292F31B|nr:Ger(x)C family spore germination protein [Fictibacillus phosphorivorans]MQR97579.1 Ger(x)C family spore germination protein [Fictibacillus phosphorivorans]
MKNRWKFVLTLSVLSIFLSGCWGATGIGDQLYIEGLGIDYKDGKYIVYTESAVFSSIAKQEGGGGQTADMPVLVGQEKGDSITMAFRKLEKTSQFPLYYGHVQFILLSDRVIKEKLDVVLSHLGHDPLIRQTSWIFGTSEDLEDVLISKAPFKQAPLYKIMFHPENMLVRNHAVNPLNMQMLFRDGKEPFGSTIIPNINLTKNKWHEDKDRPHFPNVDGGYVIQKMKPKGRLTDKELRGLEWVTKRKKENKLEIPLGNTVVELEVKGYKVHLKKPVKNELKYTLEVKAKATIDENLNIDPRKELEKHLAKKIKREIRETYRNGLSIDSDLYNLTRSTYRKSPPLVKRYGLQSDSLESVKVDVKIVHSGSQKYKK